MTLTPEQRRIRARIGALTRWSKEDPMPAMTRAREAQMSKWEKQVDPEGALSPDERRRRAESLRRAHMQKLALISSQKRAAAKAATKGKSTSTNPEP